MPTEAGNAMTEAPEQLPQQPARAFLAGERVLLWSTAAVSVVLVILLRQDSQRLLTAHPQHPPTEDQQQRLYWPQRNQSIPCSDRGRVLAALTHGRWQELSRPKCYEVGPEVGYCTERHGHRWTWDVLPCSTGRVEVADMLRLLQGKTLLFIGDSHNRYFFLRMVDMLTGNFEKHIDDYIQGHKDFEWHYDSKLGKEVPAGTPAAARADLHVLLLWRETLPAITQTLRQLRRNGTYPDAVVVSSGTWYPSLGRPLKAFKADIDALAQEAATAAQAGVPLFQITVPSRIRGLSFKYSWHSAIPLVPRMNDMIRTSPHTGPSGPIRLLDLDQIRAGCLLWCHTQDGAHATAPVYGVLIQLLMNMLRMEWQQ